MTLLTPQIHLFFIQPLAVQEATQCATYHHTVDSTLTGAPFFYPGYAFVTSCWSTSSQNQPRGPSREGCPITTRYNRGIVYPFLNHFNQFLTTPQKHLVNMHSATMRNSERALHFPGKEGQIVD